MSIERLLKGHRELLKSHGTEGSFEEAVNGSFDKVLSKGPSWLKEYTFDHGSYYEFVKNKVYASSSSDDDVSELIIVAVSALHAFIQVNVTGPALTFDPCELTVESSLDMEAFRDAYLEELKSDGEPAFQLLLYGHLLLLSEAILEALIDKTDSPLKPFCKWWYSRALAFHQALLNGQSSSLHQNIFTYLNEDTLKDIEPDHDLTIRFYCEFARAQLLYDHDKKAQSSLEKAKTESNLSYILTGLKAKRTKFQQKQTSQLVFLAKSFDGKSTEVVNTNETSTSGNQPSTLDLNSEVLLEKPEYEADGEDDAEHVPQELKQLDPNKQPALQDIDSAIILLNIAKIKQSSPHKDQLIQEELMAMAERIISSPNSSVNWSLYSRALWVRSLLEADSAKTVQRGTLQMQSLVEDLGFSNITTYLPKADVTEGTDGKARLEYIHQLLPLPKWSMDSALAERLMALGALKSALEVYERLEMWGEVALCHAAVGKSDEAVKIMEDHLKKHPKDARGWSILGDITLNPEYWEKSWEIGKYAASKRALGRYYYSPPKSAGIERNLETAIKHLNGSLQINPLNSSAWFLYGCAGLETAQWELAAEAFSRCVALDDSDAKSWSNLSTALIRMNKKSEAFNTLKRAVRAAADLNDWRIWSNYVHVAADLNDWAEAVRGLKEMILIRGDEEGERGIDLVLLEQIVQNLVESDLGNDANALTLFQKNAIELVTKIVPTYITNDARLYKLVARVNIWLRKPWTALESYEKGWRIISSNLDVTDEASWNQAVDYCTDLVDAYTNFGPMDGRIEGSVVCKDWKFKARSAIRTLMGKGKAFWEDSDGWDRLKTIKDDL
jgi:lipopolysaccharide biosynthesis regulator YciM